MNDATKLYCDGAAMAYIDVAKHLEEMINRPEEQKLKDLMICFLPLVEIMRSKAKEVYTTAEMIANMSDSVN